MGSAKAEKVQRLHRLTGQRPVLSGTSSAGPLTLYLLELPQNARPDLRMPSSLPNWQQGCPYLLINSNGIRTLDFGPGIDGDAAWIFFN
jgi:hypothetical protein